MQQTDPGKSKIRKGLDIVIVGICIVMTVAIAIFFLALRENKVRIVGRDIAAEDITEFVYTRSSSSYPPEYQRYHFYLKEGKYQSYFEKREGLTWPLRESDITCSSSIDLSDEEWGEFLNYMNSGEVRKRTPDIEAGGSAPCLYLYWKDDEAKYQEFSFASLKEQQAFESFCSQLIMLHNESQGT